jgi:hypothetical protein
LQERAVRTAVILLHDLKCACLSVSGPTKSRNGLKCTPLPFSIVVCLINLFSRFSFCWQLYLAQDAPCRIICCVSVYSARLNCIIRVFSIKKVLWVLQILMTHKVIKCWYLGEWFIGDTQIAISIQKIRSGYPLEHLPFC